MKVGYAFWALFTIVQIQYIGVGGFAGIRMAFLYQCRAILGLLSFPSFSYGPKQTNVCKQTNLCFPMALKADDDDTDAMGEKNVNLGNKQMIYKYLIKQTNV